MSAGFALARDCMTDLFQRALDKSVPTVFHLKASSPDELQAIQAGIDAVRNAESEGDLNLRHGLALVDEMDAKVPSARLKREVIGELSRFIRFAQGRLNLRGEFSWDYEAGRQVLTIVHEDASEGQRELVSGLLAQTVLVQSSAQTAAGSIVRRVRRSAPRP